MKMRLVIFLFALVVRSDSHEESSRGFSSTFQRVKNMLGRFLATSQEFKENYEEMEKGIKSFIKTSCPPCLYARNTQGGYCDCTNLEPQVDCLEFYDRGFRVSGVYRLKFTKFTTTDAYCDHDNQGGGWTVIQRRLDGSVDFDRTLDKYKEGFGNETGELWLGNDNIHYLTRNSPKSSQLLIVMKMIGENHTVFAKYSSFKVLDARNLYKLNVAGFSGTTMDGLSSEYNNNQYFVVKKTSCPRNGWWSKSCNYHTNLNAMYDTQEKYNGKSMTWYGKDPVTSSYYYKRPTYVEMKVRRNK